MTDFQVKIKIENIAPENGTFLTPFWVGVHDGSFDSFDSGRPVSAGLESLAEDGNTDGISTEFTKSGAGNVQTTITAGDDGVFAPGETAEVTLTLDNDDPASAYLNFLSMVLPSNDAFIGNERPQSLAIFDEQNNFLGLDVLVRGRRVYDAGTEVNDELPETTAFFFQDTPNTGTDENGVVKEHPGFIEGGRILTEDGTTPNAPGAFTNADFSVNDYPVARIRVFTDDLPLPISDPVKISSTLSGQQEVDPGDADASGTSTLTLNDIGDALEYSLTVTGLDFGANGWIEGGAQTPDDTSDDVTRLHIHNAARAVNGPVVFSLLDSVAPELGNELNIQGNQDEDLEITANNDGSVTLTGIWEETDSGNSPLSDFVAQIRNTEEDDDLNLYWNVHTNEFPAGAIRGQLAVDNQEPGPEVTVTIENLAPLGGTFLTPVWFGVHNGDFDLYDRGSPATPALERLAEDGDTANLSQEFLSSENGTIEGVVSETPIAPGETVTATFNLDGTLDTSRFFSYASMVVPSNDAFIANGNPLANPLFNEEGKFLGADFIVAGSQVLDAGTEENDELEANTAFFGQESPDTGVDENGVVELHPGFIEGGRILSEDGTTPNTPDGGFSNADFTTADYQVARITVSIVDDPVEITSTLNGNQEVDPGATDASGTSFLTLNDTGNSLTYSLKVTGLDFGANGWIEGGAQTPDDTSDDVTRLHIHNAPRGENGDVVFSLLDSVAPELGNVLDIQGNQDDDLELTLNDDGSVTLEGVWEGTDSASTNLSEFVSDIRDGQAGEDLDLYWNVHTEEFPAGAIRGQLAIRDDNPLDTPFNRFQNSNVPGTFLYATEQESIDIRRNFPEFVEEGVGFNASVERNDELVAFNRLRNTQQPGTFLYVNDQELQDIQNDSGLSEIFELEGFAFSVYGAGSGQATPFIRFQNSNLLGTFLYVTEEEAVSIERDFPEFVREGVAFEAVI